MPPSPREAGGPWGDRFVGAHLTPWVGLYSVMSEDSVRKLAKTVFPLCGSENDKRAVLKGRKVTTSEPPVAGLDCRAWWPPRDCHGRGLSPLGRSSLPYCTWWARPALGPGVHGVLMPSLPLGDLTHTDVPGWLSVNLSENRRELLA